MSHDDQGNDLRMEGTPYIGRNLGNLMNSEAAEEVNYSEVEKSLRAMNEMDDDDYLKRFEEEDQKDIMEIHELLNEPWNDMKSVTKEATVKYSPSGKSSAATRQVINELICTIQHLCKGGKNIGLSTLFINSPKERMDQQYEMALAANRARIKFYQGKNQKKEAGILAKERHQIQVLIKLGISQEFLQDQRNANELLKFETIKWMVAALNECNKKLSTIINSRFKLPAMNQMLSQMNQLGSNMKKGNWESMLGINTDAIDALKMIRTSGEKPTYLSYEKKLKILQEWKIDFTKLGEKGNIEAQIGELKGLVFEIDLMYEDLKSSPSCDGLLEQPRLLPVLLRKIGDSSNPTRNSPNYSKNQISWQLLYEGAYSRYLKTNDQPLLVSERIEYLENALYNLVNGGDFEKKKTNKLNGEGGGNDNFTLNVNRHPFSRFCPNVLRKGYCDKVGCKFKTMTKEEHTSRPLCRQLKEQGHCKFGNKCYYVHTGDEFDSSKSCVHRGQGNNVNTESEDQNSN